MFLNFPLELVDIMLIIVNISFAIYSFYNKKLPLKIIHLDVTVDLLLSASFMLMLSQSLVIDVLGMIMGFIMQVLQIGNDYL